MSNSDGTLKSITSQKDKDTEKEQYYTLKVCNYFNTYMTKAAFRLHIGKFLFIINK